MNYPYKFVETEPYEEGFADYYETNIVPLAIKYEKYRRIKKIHNAANIVLAIITSIGGCYAAVKIAIAIKLRGKARGNIVLLPPLLSYYFFVHRSKRKC